MKQKQQDLDVDELTQLKMSLDSLRAKLEEDLLRVRQLPETQIAQMLRMKSAASRARADALRQRLTELRLIIDSRLRTLQRLRARMNQLRGGAKPH